MRVPRLARNIGEPSTRLSRLIRLLCQALRFPAQYAWINQPDMRSAQRLQTQIFGPIPSRSQVSAQQVPLWEPECGTHHDLLNILGASHHAKGLPYFTLPRCSLRKSLEKKK